MAEITEKANLDKNTIPERGWYENLRDSDDGSFGKPLEEIPRDLTVEGRRETYLRQRVLTPPNERMRNLAVMKPKLAVKVRQKTPDIT